jgi:protein ImuB
MRTYVRMTIACVHLPRFALVLAAGGPGGLAGKALAIAPAPGAEPRVGDVSGAAEGCGIVAGMRLSEALARCPELGLLPGDPLGVAEAWDGVLAALEGIGAAVEQAREGTAYFQIDGLKRLHGGEEGVLAAASKALGRPARMGSGPTRLCALAAALQAGSRRAVVVSDRQAIRWLAAMPVGVLRSNERTKGLVGSLERLGLHTLGDLAALSRDAMADRFGDPGLLAHRLACGEEEPLAPRVVEDRLEESLELWDTSSGPALERIMVVLVERLLAAPQRRGRTVRSVTLSARLVEGGTWRERVTFRQPLADCLRMCMALSLRLAQLPGPAQALHLGVERFGPPSKEQGTLLEEAKAVRQARLGEAIGQVRALAGQEAALRAVCVDPGSRVPERQVVLAPFEG